MAERGSGAAGTSRIIGTALVVFAVAWILRVLYVFDLQASPLTNAPVLDELYHVRWASAIAAGDWVGSGVFLRAPLYPYLLGVALKLFGGSLLAARILQATYGALTPVGVFLIARRFLPKRWPLVAGALAAVYPFLLYFDNELLVASLAVVLNTFLILAVLRADEVPTWGRWLPAGVLLGLSAVARPTVLVFAPLLFFWIWWRAADVREARRSGRRVGTTVRLSSPLGTAVARFLVLALGAAAVVLPVTIRNYTQERDFVPIASSGGINFFIGNNEAADGVSAIVPILGGAWEYADARAMAEEVAGRPLKPSEVSDYWYRQGRTFIFGRPGAAIRLLWKKLVLFWNRHEQGNNKDVYYFANMSPVYRVFSWLSFGVVVPLALLGIWVSKRDRVSILMALFVLATMVGVVLFFVTARFRLPAVPFLIVSSVAGGRWLVERLQKRDARALLLGAIALVALAIAANVDYYGMRAGDPAQTHHSIGLAVASHGQHERAVEEFRRAAELSPDYAEAYNNLGLSLEQLGREEEAYQAYLTAAEKGPGLSAPRSNLGVIHRRHGDLDGAVRWFREAIGRDPDMYQAHYNLAGVLAAQGDAEGAAEHTMLALAANPNLKEAWNSLGTLHVQAGRPLDAVSAFSRALAIDPRFTPARVNLALALVGTGRLREALGELETAVRIDPQSQLARSKLPEVRALAESGSGG